MTRIQRQYSRIGGIVLASLLTITSLALMCAAPLNAATTYSSGDRHEPAQLLDGNAIEAMVAPVALYPDRLLGIVLRATRFPLQLVQASRYLEAHASDPYLEPAEDWDDAVVALLNYPEVIQLLNSDLGWTQDLGQVVTFQQPEVIQAVQHFRQRAYVAGNLQSDAQKIVNHEQGVIEILSTDPTSVYVPHYEPTKVIYTQSTPSYHYYPQRYPVYNYAYPDNHAFYANPFWGVATGYSIGWLSHRLFSHHDNFRRHNYVGRRYYHSGRRHGNIAAHRDRRIRHDNRHGFRGERHRADGYLGGRAHQRDHRRRHASNRHDRGQYHNRRIDNRRHHTPAIAAARSSRIANTNRSRTAQRNAPPARNAEQRNRARSRASRVRGGDANRATKQHRQAQRANSPAQRRSTVNNSRSNFTPALMNVPAFKARFDEARKQGNKAPRRNAMQRTQPRKARPTQRRAPTAQRGSANNAGRSAARGSQARQVRPNRTNARRAERPNRRAGAGKSRNRNRGNRRGS